MILESPLAVAVSRYMAIVLRGSSSSFRYLIENTNEMTLEGGSMRPVGCALSADNLKLTSKSTEHV